MNLSQNFSRLLLGAVLALAMIAGGVRAEQDDFGACTAERYAGVRTAQEIAATVGACTRVLQQPSASARQRAYALYFRGLNYFLDATRLAVAARQPLGTADPHLNERIEAALADLAACIATAPEPNAAPFSLRATIRTVLGQHDAAASDLGEAIRIDPRTSHHLVQRALIRERQDRFDEARADLDAALALDAGNQNAWINRARLWTRYGDIVQAASDYDRAIALGGPQSWDALSGRGKLAVRLGEPARAFADWSKAAEVAPLPALTAQLHVRAGNLARDYLKEPAKAEQSYRAALAALPNHADAVIQQGIAHERAQRWREAANAYTRAIELTRGNALERSVQDYARFRLDVLRARLSRKPGDPPLPPNINLLSNPSGGRTSLIGARVALVIGNATYAHVTPLMNADRDAESVAGALSEAGFTQVTVAINLDKAQMETLLRRFSQDAATADWAVVYYAGHGIEVDGRNFMIPIDARLASAGDIAANAVSTDLMMQAVGTARTLRLVALDACRDDPFAQEAHRVAARNPADQPSRYATARNKEIGGGLAELPIEQANTLVLFSTQPGRVALDGDELNSPFTRAFLHNIPIPGLELRQFLERVHDDVAQATERRQQPAVNGRLREGDRLSFFPL